MAAPHRKVSAYDHVLYKHREAWAKACKTKGTFATREKTKNSSAYDIFGNQILSSLLVVGPTQSGKTYFVQQILENNRIVYEEQKSIRISWYYNQWQECYEELKKSLGKSIRFERGVPELSEDLCEINPRYNKIIILDDLMAEATDSPVVSQLDCLPKAAIETPVLSYCCKTCFLKGNIIWISAEMPSIWLSSEVLAIGNKSELL